MKNKNVYLFQIQNIISGHIFLPLSLSYLWSYIVSKPHLSSQYKLKEYFFIREAVENYLAEMEDPSVVGISTYIWNWEISKEIARKIKSRWPQCLVVMGGPQVPYTTDFQKELPFVDIVVTFSGEEAFADILTENLKDDPQFLSINGTISGGVNKLVKRKAPSQLDKLPSPYLSGFFDQVFNKYPDHHFNIIIESNRGCPYSCFFCDMQDSYYTKIYKFELERVKAEIDWAVSHKIAYIDCADSNFGIFERDVEVAQHIADSKARTGYPRGFNFTSAKNQPEKVEKIQAILGSVEIDRGISISLQSFNKETLKAIKRWNPDNHRLEKTFKKI